MNLFDSLFPGHAKKRLELEAYRSNLTAAQTRDQYYIKALERLEAESMRDGGNGLNLSEAPVNQSSPWYNDLASLTLSQAWRNGYPGTELAYAADDSTIASDDAMRFLVLRVCKALYSGHPHARGLINNAAAFVVGPKAWAVEPSPKLPAFGTERGVEPLTEAFADDYRLDPAGHKIASVPSDPEHYEPTPEMPFSLVSKQDRANGTDKPMVDVPLRRRIKERWKQYTKKGVFHPTMGWKQFWREAFIRTRRDGECFIYLGHNKKDGSLTPRFLEPEDICHPTGMSTATNIFDPDANGICVDPDDPAKIIGYWFRRHDLLQGQPPKLIPAKDIIHIKYGVDSGVRRGLPAMYIVRNYLRHVDSWILQSLKHQRVQSSIALLRQWEQGASIPGAGPAAVDAYKFRTTNVKTPAGTGVDYNTVDMLPVIDAPKGMSMQMVSPNGNFGDSQILIRRVLLAIAVGTQQSEAMVTGDGSNANYASTRITQIPAFRHFEDEQGDWCEIIEEFYTRWCYTEAAMGRLPRPTGEHSLECNVTANALPNFEGEIVSGMAQSLASSEILTKRTAREMVGVDADVEEERDEAEHQEALRRQRQDQIQQAETQALLPQKPQDQNQGQEQQVPGEEQNPDETATDEIAPLPEQDQDQDLALQDQPQGADAEQGQLPELQPMDSEEQDQEPAQ